jgi:hypothetical protein
VLACGSGGGIAQRERSFEDLGTRPGRGVRCMLAPLHANWTRRRRHSGMLQRTESGKVAGSRGASGVWVWEIPGHDGFA